MLRIILGLIVLAVIITGGIMNIIGVIVPPSDYGHLPARTITAWPPSAP